MGSAFIIGCFPEDFQGLEDFGNLSVRYVDENIAILFDAVNNNLISPEPPPGFSFDAPRKSGFSLFFSERGPFFVTKKNEPT
ncbi:MAG: hypothetical protein DRP97_05490 [Candidatus Latescibacterota bacterium]|nr:MAG: hypothetical protein B1H02_03270 [Candidatus Latescibacteria bacterium 4484_107]RKY69271.1 MAG: hypothetical protein DRP97_05490 [Candidatus Latescibacterota bacterium]